MSEIERALSSRRRLQQEADDAAVLANANATRQAFKRLDEFVVLMQDSRVAPRSIVLSATVNSKQNRGVVFRSSIHVSECYYHYFGKSWLFGSAGHKSYFYSQQYGVLSVDHGFAKFQNIRTGLPQRSVPQPSSGKEYRPRPRSKDLARFDVEWTDALYSALREGVTTRDESCVIVDRGSCSDTQEALRRFHEFHPWITKIDTDSELFRLTSTESLAEAADKILGDATKL